MKKVKLFMALALLVFFGLFVYINYGSTTENSGETNRPVKMTEIKIE